MKYLSNKLPKQLLFIVLILLSFQTFAQDGPPPPPGGGSGSLNTDNNRNGNAPIGGGVFVLLFMGGAYGVFKLYQKNKKSLLD